ncbi:MAG: coproporphyrinogen dehydrogenase HemZ, partial [Lachnospiraceae bacterium]|nr:coproporphyrinogen dehydrogenase HemZ [Lachnospiraceae bacterium]
MILLEQNSNEYNNDLRAMIMAFFPGIKIVEKLGEMDMPKFVFVARYEEEETSLAILDDYSDTETIVGNYLDKSNFRNKLKSASYELLCRYTGRTLPWGDLTGVRPTKIAMACLNYGKTFEDTVANYIDTYHVSERKAKLATKVADFERNVIAKIDKENDYCLYVGIPFCPSRCLYCSFTSYPIGVYRDKAAMYVDKLCEELDFIAREYKDKNLVSIYIGGGTPTSIDHMLLDKLLTKIDTAFNLG